MGRAMRWLKRILLAAGGRKEEHGGLKDNHAASDGVPEKEKKRWSFVKQRKSGVVDGGNRPSDAVAAAAVAEPSRVIPCHCGGEEGVRARLKQMAAVVIQKSFRGYLFFSASARTGLLSIVNFLLVSVEWILITSRDVKARKALRALRSLVKLQALVRGYLVRKQAATTLRRLQALMRLQADSSAVKRASYRRSMEQVRIITRDPRMTPSATPDHRRRVSDSTDSNQERSPRIVEMDTCHLRSRSTRTMSSRYTADNLSCRLAPSQAPPSCSPLSSKEHPPRLSIRWRHERDLCHAKTTQNTPRFLWPTPPPHDSPAKSVDGSLTPRSLSHRDALVSPRYMAGTASSAARMRCQSSPRQLHAEAPPRASLTHATPRMPCTRVQGSFCFHCSEAARTGFSDLSDEAARDYYLDKMW